MTNSHIYRSSPQEVFCKKGVLGNFAKFTGKHLRHSLFFNQIADPMSATLLKKRLWHRCSPVNFAKFFKNTFFYRTPVMAASVFKCSAVNCYSMRFILLWELTYIEFELTSTLSEYYK